MPSIYPEINRLTDAGAWIEKRRQYRALTPDGPKLGVDEYALIDDRDQVLCVTGGAPLVFGSEEAARRNAQTLGLSVRGKIVRAIEL